MTLATHRVVGVLDWPTGSEMSPEVLDVLRREVLPGDDPTQLKVLSLRLPVSEVPNAEVLSADLSQLRIDLGRLFAQMADEPVV